MVVKGAATLSTIVYVFFLLFAFVGIMAAYYTFISASIDTLGPMEKVLVMLTGPVVLIGIISLVTNRDDLALFLFGKERF